MLTKRKRRILFWLSGLIFVILLAPVFLYTFGYGVGPGLKIQRTGGIAVTASASNALVSASPFRKKKTSLISKNAVIKNLIPGEYEVEVNKDGFWEWEKNLSVFSEKVTEREVLLIPRQVAGEILGTTSPVSNKPYFKKNSLYARDENGKEKILFSSVKKFWELPKSGEYLILGEDKNFYRNKKLETTLATSTLKILKEGRNILFSEDENEIISWDSSKIELFWIGPEDKMPFWMDKTRYKSFVSGEEIREVKNYSGQPDYMVINMENGIWALEKEAPENNIAPLYKGKNPKIISMESKSLILLDDGNYIKIELP
ncbi:MAG: hypothetical protein AAB556_01710 [Patescibacteria group bacterium]